MRHRVALALLVATCVARCGSSTSMDDHVNKKTEAADEDDEIEESRIFGINTAKGVWSRAFGGTKIAGATDDAAAKTVKAVGTGKAVTNRVKVEKKHVAWAATVIAGILGALTLFAYSKAQESEKMTPLESLSASEMGSTTGSAMGGSSGSAMDGLSGFAMDGSSGFAMDGLSGLSMDELAALGYDDA